MVDHKAWEWKLNKSDRWHIPCIESYYLINRWHKKKFNFFLDLGCGMGRHSFIFEKSGFICYAFDLSEDAIEFVKKKSKKEKLSVQADVGDMTQLPYDNNFFDCLLAYNVISHTDTSGVKKTVSEIKRVLKPGGEFYLSLCSKNTWGYKESNFPFIDENTKLRTDEGPENGIPHFFADEKLVDELFSGCKIQSLRHVQDLIINEEKYISWHYFILGKNNNDSKKKSI